MALDDTVMEQFDRLRAHFRVWEDAEQYAKVADDWLTSLTRVPDASVTAAGDTFVRGADKMPSLNEFLSTAQRHAREALSTAEAPAPPLSDEEAQELSEALSELLGAVYGRLGDARWGKNSDITRGHRHRPGEEEAGGCPACLAEVALPELIPTMHGESTRARFTCSCGEGQGWIWNVERTAVRPCEFCKPGLYAQWRDAASQKRHTAA